MLEKILDDLIAKAKATPRKEVSYKLKNNLHVYLFWQEPFYTMTLARDNAKPGVQEMKTCIAYLPKHVRAPTMEDVRETTHHEREALAVNFVEAKYVEAMLE